MKTIKSIYYHIKGTPKAEEMRMGSAKENYLKAEVCYTEGGYSLWTYENKPRGYYMHVSMVGRGKDECGAWESMVAFQNRGAKEMIAEVTRQSKKREAEALAYFEEHIDDYVAKVFSDLEYEKEVS